MAEYILGKIAAKDIYAADQLFEESVNDDFVYIPSWAYDIMKIYQENPDEAAKIILHVFRDLEKNNEKNK